MDTENKQSQFDPSGVGNKNNNIFGLPFEVEESRLVFIPVPWDVTVTNTKGAAEGPQNVFSSSFQIDLYDPMVPGAWKAGMAMEQIDPGIISTNQRIRLQAEKVIRFLEDGGDVDENGHIQGLVNSVNEACESLALTLEKSTLQYLENNQLPFLIGGDHSCTTGQIRALARESEFGILQIDAHADMRKDYQGFTHSHASVMHHALETKGVTQIVQVGIRELCNEEVQVISQNHKKVKTYFDHDLHERLFEGENWSDICSEIIEKLPDNIYITFDVDGLEPSLCPGTGTPVPGGLSFNQAIYLLETAMKMGKRIIGADVVETGPTTLDGIVSCRIIYRMAGMMIQSNE